MYSYHKKIKDWQIEYVFDTLFHILHLLQYLIFFKENDLMWLKLYLGF